jgi:hypothetical protein
VAALLVACDGSPFVPQAPMTAVAEEHLPGPASVRVVGDPVVASRPLIVALTRDGFRREARVATGERIRAEFNVSQGGYRLIGGDDACSVVLELAPSNEADLVLRLPPDGGCELLLTGTHPFGAVRHPDGELGSVSTQVPLGRIGGVLTMDLRSLDDPPNPVPDAVTVDEGGNLIVDGVVPGTYEARLLQDGEPIATAQVVVDAQGRSSPLSFALASG